VSAIGLDHDSARVIRSEPPKFGRRDSATQQNAGAQMVNVPTVNVAHAMHDSDMSSRATKLETPTA
jgi:hypothetical protein